MVGNGEVNFWLARDPGGIGYAGRLFMFATAPLCQVRQAKLMLAEERAEVRGPRTNGNNPESGVKMFNRRLHGTLVLAILLHLGPNTIVIQCVSLVKGNPILHYEASFGPA